MRLENLSESAQRQVLQKLALQKQQQEKPSKYRNQKDERITASGTTLRFDSRKEARRFDELSALQRVGSISGLKLQPQFTLQEAYTAPEGVRVRAIRYQADFSYSRDGKAVVEDVKSEATRTRVYELKKKLLREKFGIEITEI